MAYKLNPNKRNELVAHFEVKAKSQEVTKLLVDLEVKNAITTDPVKNLVGALNEAESTEFLKAHGVENQNSVTASLNNKLRRKQYDISLKDGEILSGLNTKMAEPNFDESSIYESGLSPKGVSDAFRLLRVTRSEIRSENRVAQSFSIEQRRQTKIAEQEKSDTIHGRILNQIVNGGETSVPDIIAERQNGLSKTDASDLINNYNKIRDNPELKAAYKIVNDKFAKVDPAGADRLRKEIFRANFEEGLKGTALIQRATTMIDGAKSNKVKELLNNVWDYMSTNAKEKFTGNFSNPSSPVDKTLPVKTVTINGKQYKDGDTITQKDGSKGIVRVK